MNNINFYRKYLIFPAKIPLFLLPALLFPNGWILYAAAMGVCISCGWLGHVIALGFNVALVERGNEKQIEQLTQTFPLRASLLQFLAANIVINVVELFQRNYTPNQFNATSMIMLAGWSVLSVIFGYLYLWIGNTIKERAIPK